MAQVSFELAEKIVDEFLTLLSGMGVDVKAGSRTEGDALAMTEVLEIWRGRAVRPADPRPVLRAALGFVDLAGKVLAVRNSADVPRLDAHLRQLASGSVLQNRFSPATDAVANKMVELYFGALAMRVGEDVVLDDPDHSKGDNPDVMLSFRNQRWALAMKTLASARNPQTIYENIKKGSDQIQGSSAEHGLVVVNLKNVIDHDALWPVGDIPTTEDYAKSALLAQIDAVTKSLSGIPQFDWLAAIGHGRKAHSPVLFLAQSAFFAQPTFGGQSFPMPLKMLATFMVPNGDPFGAMKLANALNHYMQPFV
jgi:hypothetical protein